MEIRFRGEVVCMVMVLGLVVPSFATVYTVGDSSGWNVGSDYSTWTSDKTFKVGDSLFFSYIAGAHAVDEVSKIGYDLCTIGKSLLSDSSGSTTIPLVAPGTRYFICSTNGHCGSGMKLAVTITGPPLATSPPSPIIFGPPPAPIIAGSPLGKLPPSPIIVVPPPAPIISGLPQGKVPPSPIISSLPPVPPAPIIEVPPLGKVPLSPIIASPPLGTLLPPTIVLPPSLLSPLATVQPPPPATVSPPNAVSTVTVSPFMTVVLTACVVAFFM